MADKPRRMTKRERERLEWHMDTLLSLGAVVLRLERRKKQVPESVLRCATAARDRYLKFLQNVKFGEF